jgi:hypothetical protein
MKSTEDLILIVRSGGSVVIDASMTTQELAEIAYQAAGKGGRVIIKGASRKATPHLVQIASQAKGAVIFDLTD